MILKLVENRHTYRYKFIEVSVVSLNENININIYDWSKVESPFIAGKTLKGTLDKTDEQMEIENFLREIKILEDNNTIKFSKGEEQHEDIHEK